MQNEISDYAKAKRELATAVMILTYDRSTKTVDELMAGNTSWKLREMLQDELAELDDRVKAEGKIEINNWMDGEWLAGKLEAEYGTEVIKRTHNGQQHLKLVE